MPRPGYIYVMDAGDNLLKVGFSNSPERRALDLGGLTILHETDWLPNAELVEKSAHKLLKLDRLHVQNELFKATLDEAKEAISRATKIIAAGQVVQMPDGRRKKSVSFALDADLVDALEQWIGEQPAPPSKTAVIETALSNFMEERNAIFEEMAEADETE